MSMKANTIAKRSIVAPPGAGGEIPSDWVVDGVTYDAGNTGNGTSTSPVLGEEVQWGVYEAVCTDIGTPALWDIISPSGETLGVATTGVEFSHAEITLTISAGVTPWAVDDLIEYEVRDASWIPYYGTGEDGDFETVPSLNVSYSGTGNGVIINETPVGATVHGDYSVKCTTAPTTFTVTSPVNGSLGTVEAGNTFSHAEISFDLTVGGTDFILNDEFTIASDGVVAIDNPVGKVIAKNYNSITVHPTHTLTWANAGFVAFYSLGNIDGGGTIIPGPSINKRAGLLDLQKIPLWVRGAEKKNLPILNVFEYNGGTGAAGYDGGCIEGFDGGAGSKIGMSGGGGSGSTRSINANGKTGNGGNGNFLYSGAGSGSAYGSAYGAYTLDASGTPYGTSYVTNVNDKGSDGADAVSNIIAISGGIISNLTINTNGIAAVYEAEFANGGCSGAGAISLFYKTSISSVTMSAVGALNLGDVGEKGGDGGDGFKYTQQLQ